MNFEPPDYSVDVSPGSSDPFIKTTINYSTYPKSTLECSPLLRNSSKPANINGYSNNTNRNSNAQFKVPIQNRLGGRGNFHQNRNNRNTDQTYTNINNDLGQNNFNRKRAAEGNVGPVFQKRKWGNKPSFYQKLAPNQLNTVSVQNRLDRIRNKPSKNDDSNIRNTIKQEMPEVDFSDTQSEMDPTDITVQIVNNVASTTNIDEANNHLARFKMILDPKAQTAIKMLQQKRTDKQVICPLPVTPSVTSVSLHQRFSQLD